MGREVRLVRIELTEPDPGQPAVSRHVNLGPAIYDLAGYEMDQPRRPSRDDSVPEDFAQYLKSVLTDMNDLIGDIVSMYAAEWALKTRNPTAATSFSAVRESPTSTRPLCAATRRLRRSPPNPVRSASSRSRPIPACDTTPWPSADTFTRDAATIFFTCEVPSRWND